VGRANSCTLRNIGAGVYPCAAASGTAPRLGLLLGRWVHRGAACELCGHSRGLARGGRRSERQREGEERERERDAAQWPRVHGPRQHGGASRRGAAACLAGVLSCLDGNACLTSTAPPAAGGCCGCGCPAAGCRRACARVFAASAGGWALGHPAPGPAWLRAPRAAPHQQLRAGCVLSRAGRQRRCSLARFVSRGRLRAGSAVSSERCCCGARGACLDCTGCAPLVFSR
jgi:hypothetical protein